VETEIADRRVGRRTPLLPLLLTAATLALVAAGCGGSSGETTASSGAVGDSGAAGAVCDEVSVPAAGARTGEKPATSLAAGASPTLTFETNCGTFVITLDAATGPNTGASLVALAESGYYDETIVHRIVPGFVIQGGDPTQEGGGGPGYSTVDVPPSDARYVKGVVAMAKTELEPPGTAGSQWFVVTGDDVGLPPDYAIVGSVTEGLDVVEKIGALGDAAQKPTEPVVVRTVTVGGQ
jgi:peptidyl-prolyl cis-trans isomerase B (cyclophilin B)